MKTVGIIVAMEEQIISIKRKMIIEDIKEKAGMTFYTGMIQDKKVVLVKTHTGKVSATVCTQMLIDLFDVYYIIHTGVAGGLHPDVQIGDMIIASDTIEQKEESIFIKENIKLEQMAEKMAKDVVQDQKVFVGHIASQDQFVGSMNVKGEIHTTFTTYCTEMEGAAIAHTCYLNQAPFIMIRTISDKADQSADINFEEFVHVVTRNESKMLEQIIETL